ncbi:MAG: radical SAM protein, partial [Thermodesulfobacterium sp.]|nr:radical SAM protein [Thermodesulfobacterium sp.]
IFIYLYSGKKLIDLISDWIKKYSNRVESEKIKNDIFKGIAILHRVGLLKVVPDEIYSAYSASEEIDHLKDFNIKNHGFSDISIEIGKERPYCPISVELDLTYRCNAKCVHCIMSDVNKSKSEELGFEEITSLMTELENMGTFVLSFSGGEITIRDDFLKIFKEARKRGFYIAFITNGIILGRNEEMLRSIANLWPGKVGVSLYGIRPETHDRFTGIPGSFDLALKTIKFFKNEGIDVNIRTSVTKINFEEFIELSKFAEDLNVDIIPGFIIVPTLQGNLKPSELNLTGRDLIKVMHYHYKKMDKLSFPARVCSAGRSRVYISPYGEVYPCNTLPLLAGNIRFEKFSYIWSESGVFKLLRSLKDDCFVKCQSCDLRKYCKLFCWGVNYLFGGSIFDPPEIVCNYAEIFKGITEARKKGGCDV